ncbi:probable multidrug resistance-associated protein lethal(2)03659 [Acyrthosiphon pisum]|uniref:Multidrug resistance-associated protein lethal(2)03659 n=1 Tax=Acyrthosiphon pisum TaxID=7029 RepID=A0A8R2HAY9_ACYPI|nr:probable multidrug resistance-associated protein lethal(2)03659 [Acyrthosiphon pisum]|eukprot:XP_016663044.1 PREDICTED: probable multidrug resistance-associated protein lethal(2)03659 [Acyrthosiphon pisum]
MDATYKEEKPLNPRSKANIFEIITYGWILKFIKKGLKKEFDLADLYNILDGDSSALLGNKLQKYWDDELINAKTNNRKPSFLKTLFKMFGTKFIIAGLILTIFQLILSIGISTMVGLIINHFETNTSSFNQNPVGVYLAIGLISLLLIRAIIYNYIAMSILHLSMKMRVATCDLIYNKALRLKINSLDPSTTGHIINLMSNDVNRFDVSVIYLPFLWLGPLETIVSIFFLWQEVGVSSVIGVGTLLIFIPLQIWLASKTSIIRLQTANRTDERVHLMNEIISGLQTIKMYTWEPFFDNLTRQLRKKEMTKIIESSYIKRILSSFFIFNTRIAVFVNIFSYVLLGNYITASKVFVITSYYNILRSSLTLLFPPGISLAAELLVSIKRFEDFLLREEKDKRPISQKKTTTIMLEKSSNGIEMPNNNSSNQNDTDQLSNSGIVVSNATAKWSNTQTDNTLDNINLTVKPGRLVAIIGPVGAGKSSLIQAILQELPLSEGNISLRGVVSYASQEPWLFAGSVKQNILFGSPMDKDRYKRVIQVCALKTDLEQLTYGDRTIVGERGVSLSGGQRARINLARAIYKEADIYLLDDPLSAVDTRVGKHLYEKCIKNYLKEKTCILVTHQIQYLINVDQIVLMENGKVVTEGSYKELQTSGLHFTKLLESSTETAVLPGNDSKMDKSSNNNIARSISYIRRESILSVASSIEEIKFSEIITEPVEEAETRSSENISSNIYMSYIFAGGHLCKVIGLILVCICTQVLTSGGDYWITYWVNLEERVFGATKPISQNNSTTVDSSVEQMQWIVSRNTCIIVFAALTILIVLATLAESTLLVSVCTTASTNLHNEMFHAITRSTMNFLNKNSSGRILNRFSKDIGLIDEILPNVLVIVIQIGLMVIGMFVVVVIVNPYLIIPTIIVMMVFVKMRYVYMTSTRNIKRLEGVTRSPIYTHVNASILGLTTVRSFEVEQILSKEFAIHQDLHSSAWYLFIALGKAFGFWLDIICLLFISSVTFYFIFIDNDTYGGNVGLAITQSIGLTSLFQWVIVQSAELENQMTSVERVLEYSNVPQEPPLESHPDKKPSITWPQEGQIIFKTFYLRYDPDAPFVLNNLNINIAPAEKVGIVGRTGAGKSSLIAALFRLAFNEGNIIIDSIEIHELGLHDLRSKISIIPQEPVLFSGTIRNNLDPFDEYPDHVLWKALEEVELKYVVEDLSNGLNSKISEGGSNFSVGQRQLVCLARAIIRNNKILVLDEATANVDPQTDSLIQNTIRNKFSKCTVLTIAHRLNTVMDSDKILVIDAGTVVEFDHPHNLLKNENGFFYKMVAQTGQNNAQSLHSIA